MHCNTNKLLGVMKERGFTQDSLALATGMSKATLGRRIKNSNEFTIKEIENIRNAMGLSKEESINIFLCSDSLKYETISINGMSEKMQQKELVRCVNR